MLAAVRSASVLGIRSYGVTVEVDASQGLPQFTIVGLPAGAVRESRERVLAALANSGFVPPPRRYTVNLAPADVRKEGTAFDLPIALGILQATGQLRCAETMARTLFVGELGLDGSIRSVRGVLAIARALQADELLVVSRGNLAEASLVQSASLHAAVSLRDLVHDLRTGALGAAAGAPELSVAGAVLADFSDVIGQGTAKRALEVAAAGGHAVLLSGPPGAGKTMLARRLPSILPQLQEDEALEVMSIHSVAGLLADGVRALPTRPFRAPHHTVSAAGLIGGGSVPRPGEVSLAHHGVLFLDEMLEFPRGVLDALRQPMEDGRVTIARSAGSVTFPARFALVGAMNNCLCGRAGTARESECSCSDASLKQYQARLSGPLRDRIDIRVAVSALGAAELSASSSGTEGSDAIRARVADARRRQLKRFSGAPGTRCNAHVTGSWVRQNARIDRVARSLMVSAADRLELSGRAYDRVLKVALTIADLADEDCITSTSVAEALRYR